MYKPKRTRKQRPPITADELISIHFFAEQGMSDKAIADNLGLGLSAVQHRTTDYWKSKMKQFKH